MNAGHNAPIVFGSGSTAMLEATGMPLGLFSEAEYEARIAVIPRGGGLLVFTDGLTDSIRQRIPQLFARGFRRQFETHDADSGSLVDPTHNEDDITILLVKRTADSASSA